MANLSAAKYSLNKFHVDSIQNIMKKYFTKLSVKNQKNIRILDVGTASGNVLVETVLPFLPKNYKEIIGTDISKDMIDCCKNMEVDPRISFKQLDIQTRDLPEDMKNRFDFIFSSYCLQFVKDIRETVKNCVKLLKPNGELMFHWSAINFVYSAYAGLNKIEKWEPYTKEFQNFQLDPQLTNTKEARKLFEESGFEIITCAREEKYFNIDNTQIAFGIFQSLDTIGKNIPASEFSTYTNDYRKCASEVINIDLSQDAVEGQKLQMYCPTIIMLARKNKKID